MARFLNTSGTNFFLEEMVKNTQERLIFISPYLKLNDRLKELLEDKNRLKIDIRIVYGKSDLRPAEAEWLAELSFVRTSFCKNLHAKCYINEDKCIITSLNLYEFSQVNNNEMGVLIDKHEDTELYRDAYDEALRIIRISDEDVTLIASTQPNSVPAKAASKSKTAAVPESKSQAEPSPKASTPSEAPATQAANNGTQQHSKLTIARLAKALSLSRAELTKLLAQKGYVRLTDDKVLVTNLGLSKGGEARTGKYGDYTLWPESIDLSS
tara:strand:+ start:1115 stop:1918 length:804 start_codon:yes stop_codon:yes gene_type:complete